ncbi:MAG: YjgP/YjgQ family permease [Candidatus Eisenbacteria bacterium]|uniref:YjgP/YjgQ family permease n=1 Tax=Eiseniibacteriota bacterium TaxID=2212470 RepID=A0A538U508_UNCEI|nr:MAG: YjgP/YjgQ family permease [Candidatus Eisenbacteria bacterium]
MLVATLMTFGRLSQDNEITALRASGVHLGSILIGPLFAAAILSVGLTAFNNYVLPESNHEFMNLLIDIGRMRPTVKLQEGTFITDFPGYDLLVQSVNGRTNEMRGVTIYQLNAGGPPTTILAKSGSLTYTPDGRTAVLRLRDGEIHEIPTEEGGARKHRRLSFKTHVINIAGAGAILERSARSTRSDRELSAASLLAQRREEVDHYANAKRIRRTQYQGRELTPETEALLQFDDVPWRTRMAQAWTRWRLGHGAFERLMKDHPNEAAELNVWLLERDAYRKRLASLSVEIHKKFSLPAACLVFVLIGAPIGMRVRRAGPAVAFLSVAFFLFYWLCLIGGEELAHRLIIPAWLAMWLPNLVLGTLGLHWTVAACDIELPWGRKRRASGARIGGGERRAVA